MSNRHELGNMIFNLENRKNLKEVKFTKDAVREVLGYLKELYEIKDKEHEENRRVADLEAKLAEKEKERHEEWLTGKEWKWECDRLKREQNQTAIAELEKVKAKVRDVSGALALCEIEVQIDQQIKSLKGEK